MATILIIDDEEFICTLVKRILSKSNYTVLSAENGTTGVELYKSQASDIDLAIIDMTMDDLNGLEVLEQIRSLTPDFPGIISSGNSYDESEIPTALLKNLYFLQKPYRSKELTELVNSILVTA